MVAAGKVSSDRSERSGLSSLEEMRFGFVAAALFRLAHLPPQGGISPRAYPCWKESVPTKLETL